MSQYLIERIEAIDKIEVFTQTEIVAFYGPGKATGTRRWRNRTTGQERERPIRTFSVYRGGFETAWLKDSGIILDFKNFVLTGSTFVRRGSHKRSIRPSLRWKRAFKVYSQSVMYGGRVGERVRARQWAREQSL